jgi:hypothetical protein
MAGDGSISRRRFHPAEAPAQAIASGWLAAVRAWSMSQRRPPGEIPGGGERRIPDVRQDVGQPAALTPRRRLDRWLGEGRRDQHVMVGEEPLGRSLLTRASLFPR